MTTVVELQTNRAEDARQRFADHVQSIAFNLTLSRHMIEMLRLCRDFGWPLDDAGWTGHRSAIASMRALSASGRYDTCTPMRALERRGLAYHSPSPSQNELVAMTERQRAKWKGHRHYRLTRAGELVCGLLVEAGLMPIEEAERKVTRA